MIMNSLVIAFAIAAAPPAPAPSDSAGSAPSTATPAPGEVPGPALTVLHLDEAVRQALAAQPTLRQAQAQTLAAEARNDQALSQVLPQMSASVGYQRTTSNCIDRPGSATCAESRASPISQHSKWKTFDYYSGSATLSQTLFDYGSFQRYRGTAATTRAQRSTESATRLSVLLSVRAAFFNARGTRSLLRVAEETVRNQRRHLEQVQGFVEVGTRPQIDLAQSRADLANAEVQRINADNNYRTAKAQLMKAMGREGPADFEVADDTLPEVQGEDAAPALLLDEALRARPELASLQQQVQAQELTIAAAHGGYLPTLGVGSTATYGGIQLNELGWNWNASATLSWQLFQGGLTAATVREAEANIAALRAQLDAERQQVSLEIEQARLGVNAARAALAASITALENANERLSLAEARYRTGVGSIIELGDAQVAETNAAGQRVQAEYNLASARAQLLQALGRE
jgi:outer membrane protein